MPATDGGFHREDEDAPGKAAALPFSEYPQELHNVKTLPDSSVDVALAATTPTNTTRVGQEGFQDGLYIRLWYLDDATAFQSRRPHVIDAATLRQLLPEEEEESHLDFVASSAYPHDHFGKFPLPPPARMATSPPPPTTELSEPVADEADCKRGAPPPTNSSPAFSPIRLSSSSPAAGDARPAWVSVKAATEEELTSILACLPVHILTRRRIISLLCSHPGNDAEKAANHSEMEDTSSGSDEDEDEDEERYVAADGDASVRHRSSLGGRGCRRYNALGNFLEYFPAHGYAVLCLQAVPLEKGESTRCGTISHEGVFPRDDRIPCTPVIAVAFESTLFTFSAGRFGGEGDVRLIIANHLVPTRSLAATARGTSLRQTKGIDMASCLPDSTVIPAMTARRRGAESAAALPGDQSISKETREEASASLSEGGSGKDAAGISKAECPEDSHFTRGSPNLVEASNLLAFPESSLTTLNANVPSLSCEGHTVGHRLTSSGASNQLFLPSGSVATAISVVCSSLVSAIIAYLQQSVRVLLMKADQLDELVLQILPSRVDQDDLLLRTKNLRNLIACFHMDALKKERVLKELLLPAMRQTPLAQSPQALGRYQRSLSSVRNTILRLRKGRDIVHMASMTLISGVSARLLTHCNFMDYLNNVQTEIAVVVMPITIIPGLFSMNVRVPFMDVTTPTAYAVIVSVTLGLFFIGVAAPLYRFFKYKSPGALASLE